MNIYTDLNIDGYERVISCENEKVGLKSLIAIHSTKLGPALGGCRMWDYKTKEDAITDVLRLSKGMTKKSALAGLPLGGAKAIIWGNSKKDKTVGLFEAMGEFVEHLDGKYIIAEDVGTTLEDLRIMARKTQYAGSTNGSGNPSPKTAFGVYKGIKATVKYKLGLGSLRGLKVAIQGVGAVGKHLAFLLFVDGCDLIISDINDVPLKELEYKIDAKIVPEDEIHKIDCDIFSPCALGATLNLETIPQLQCSVVAGCANNQLLVPEYGLLLKERGILYAPDYVINAGGLMNVFCEIGQVYNENKVLSLIENIPSRLLDIYKRSDETGFSTNSITNFIVEEILHNS
ncbi:hypothetical protein LCGC14_0740180 [marine sediment metagenome]|uniref:Glutamate/phenylalanine/leucine/valine/L-tryptophan dehydrogenase C-terminal domain-containing protein n=1 Tax=marine sediment metagenome TaxID=412755 RepID=A0A0F9TEA8_9ZZZZ